MSRGSRNSEVSRRILARCFSLLLVGLICAAPIPARAADRPGAIQGRVQNSASGDYLNNARVQLLGTNQVVFSDETGSFRVADFGAGDVKLRVSYTGMDSQELAVRVEPGTTTQVEVSLTSRTRYALDSGTVKLGKFTVAATREMDAESLAINEQRYAPNSKIVLAADAFGDVSEGNLGEFAKRLPGVNVANEAAGDALQLSVRGFNPEFTLVTMDGNSVPGAGASAGTISRGITMQQVGTNNVSRIEVIKSPIPSMPADFLGGSINLISKSAFERSKPQLTFGTLLQWSQFDEGGFSLVKKPGFMGRETRKVRPGYDFSYVNPVAKNFGFTLGASLSDQFGSLYGPLMTYDFTPANGGSEAAPFLRNVRTTDDPRQTKRQTYSGSIDWRPWEALTLSFGYSNSANDQVTYNNRLGINTGPTPASFGPTFTQGRAGAGAATHQQIYVDVFGDTDQFRLSGKYQKGLWKVDASAAYAASNNNYVDTGNGIFRSVATTIAAPTVKFEGVSGRPYFPQVVEMRNASGGVIDWTRLASYRMSSVTSAPRDARDNISSGNLNLRRNVALGKVPGAIQIGGSLRERVVDRHGYTPTWTFVGADGLANTADDAAGPFVDRVYTRVNQGSGVPSEIEFPDLAALYNLYKQRPEYFVLVEPTAFISKMTNSERIREKISAAYVQGELKFLENRLTLLGGVRFEKTNNTGVGRLLDRQAHLQRNAAGNLMRSATGAVIPITSNALEVAKLQYKERGATSSTAYDGFYPSVNSIFALSSGLQFRLSYAQTLGRPDFSNVVPNLDVQENTATVATDDGTITMRNPKLKPWTADNFDIAIEYYIKTSGVASVSVFRKNIKNAFSSQVARADASLLAEYGLDEQYLNWNVSTTVNLGEPMTISGAELNYQQALVFLPAWARGVSAYANATFLRKDGPDSSFSTLYRKTINWGLRYSRERVGLGLNWNYLSERSLAFAGPPGGVRFTKPSLTLDLNAEFRISPRVSLFYNARNFTNALYRREVFNSRTPAYSRPYQDIENGSKMSLGVRGKF
jgi:iron complex outermembrane receptor protein